AQALAQLDDTLKASGAPDIANQAITIVTEGHHVCRGCFDAGDWTRGLPEIAQKLGVRELRVVSETNGFDAFARAGHTGVTEILIDGVQGTVTQFKKGGQWYDIADANL
ncbi:MAG: hypothetical protein WBE58_23320, partial [Verrucomicrobiales bacterium]